MYPCQRTVPGWGAALVFVLVLALQAIASCSPDDVTGKGPGSNKASGGSGSGTEATGGFVEVEIEPPPPPPALEGLASIDLGPEPPDPMIIGYPSPAMHLLRATGTFEDGSQQDVSQKVTWTVDAPAGAPVTVSYGRLTIGIPGRFTVTVSNGDVSTSITVNARVEADYNPDNVAAEAVDLLKTAEATSEVPLYYPLPGSVFPAGFPMPEFQIQASQI